MAYRAGVPVLPTFITMTDDERLDGSGYPIQRFTLHIMPAIYPDPALGEKAGAEKMKEEAYALCKAKYEEVYGIPLTYGEKENEETEEEQAPMKNEHKYSLVLIAVNQGYTDAVMQAARQAGATGGTIIRARLAADDTAEQFHGFNLSSEKEIVAILTADTIKESVMNAVNSQFGLKSEAQGMVLSLPVDKAFKI